MNEDTRENLITRKNELELLIPRETDSKRKRKYEAERDRINATIGKELKRQVKSVPK